jgi:hypothetical protein
MKTIQIYFPPTGPPTVNPDTQVCLSEETLVFEIYSENTYIEAVNLAFDDTTATIFCCPGSAQGERQHHCKDDLVELTTPPGERTGVTWGIAPEHTAELPRSLKYTITPFVLGNRYEDGEVDPFIVITRRPVAIKTE